MGQCLDCPPGYFTNMTTRICSLCYPGKFTSEANQMECEMCPPGKHANYPVQTVPYPEPRQREDVCVIEFNQRVCRPVYNATGNERPDYDDPAQPGAIHVDAAWVTYNDTGTDRRVWGSNLCTDCLLGQYQPNWESTDCEWCPYRDYADERGQPLCKYCSFLGTWAAKTASDDSEVGSCDGAEFCKMCSAGRYNKENVNGCITCDGRLSSIQGSTACDFCISPPARAGAAFVDVRLYLLPRASGSCKLPRP